MIRIALVNGYSEGSRQGFREQGIPQAEDIFGDCMRRLLPEAHMDVLHPDSDPDFFAGRAVSDYHAYLWSGSSGTIYDGSQGSERQIKFMQSLFEHDRPIWGSCWGMQVAVMAAGGTVQRARAGREWVVARRVQVLHAGHAMFTGKPEVFDAIAMHLDEVERMPQDALVLARNDHSEVQAIEMHRGGCVFWGVQYHPELDHHVMAQLVDTRRDMLLAEGKARSQLELDGICNDLRTLAVRTGAPEVATIPGESISGDAELASISERLGMHWTAIERRIAERELENWVEFCVKPRLAGVSKNGR